MMKGKYYFPKVLENDELAYVAQLSKETLREIEKITEIFQNNYNLIFIKSPGQVSPVMKENSQSIFRLSPNSLMITKQQMDISSRIKESNENLSTPVKRNSTFPPKYLPNDDDASKEASESSISETKTFKIPQRRIFSPKETTVTTIKPAADATDAIDNVIASPSSLKKIDNSDWKNIERLSFDSTVDVSPDVDQKLTSPNACKTDVNKEAVKEESPRSAQTTKMFAGLNFGDCESNVSPKENTMSDILKDITQISENFRQNLENIEKNYSKNQDSCELDKSLKITNLTKKEKFTPSPVKQANIYFNNDEKSEIQMSVCPGEKDEISSNTDEDNKVTGVTPTSDKMNISPRGRNETAVISDEKRKSPSPMRNKLWFRSMPKIIYSDGSDEFDIEFPYESEENLSPTTFNISPRHLRVREIRENNTDVNTSTKESNECDVSRNALKNLSNPLGNTIHEIDSSSNVKENNTPIGNVPRTTVTPTTRSIKSISPETSYHPKSPLDRKTLACSPVNFSKPNELETDNDIASGNSISPSTTNSPKDPLVTKTNSPTGDNGYNPRKTISPTTSSTTATTSPKVYKPLLDPLENISSCSPHSFSKTKEAQINNDQNLKKLLSPSNTISPKDSECQLSPSNKNSWTYTPASGSEIKSPCNIKGVFRKQISPPSCDSNFISKQIDDSDAKVLRWFINRLTKLISQCDERMNESFESFSEFQKELSFLFLYIKKVVYAVEKIMTIGDVSKAQEIKTTTIDFKATAHKLLEKLNLWKTTGDSEIQAWIHCFEKIKHVKSCNESLMSNNMDSSPVNSMNFLRTYEKNLKSEWKKMDDMKILEDLRRTSFLKTTPDFGILMKLFVKCLIIIGVLKLRSEISSK